MKPFLKYYFKKNPRYGTAVKEFVIPSEEDYELLLSHAMNHGGDFGGYDNYVVEMRIRHYDSEADAIKGDMELASIAIGSEERLKELIENGPEDDGFIKWVEKGDAK